MKTETIIAKIIADVRARACIDEDAEIIKEILQESLNAYFEELNDYFEEEYSNAIASVRSKAYDEGYELGYDVCYASCHPE